MSDRDAFDLFQGLEALGRRRHGWYGGLTPEGKKAAAPFVIMRWMSGTSDKAQIVRINTFVNPVVFSLGQNKELLFGLLAAAATGSSTRYSWLKAPGAKQQKMKLEVVKQYYNVSSREAAGYEVDAEDALEMAQELGWDEEAVKKLKAEVTKDGSRSAESASSKPKKGR